MPHTPWLPIAPSTAMGADMIARLSQDVAGLLESFPHPVVLTDGQNDVLLANSRALQTFPRLAIGRPLTFAIRDPDVLDSLQHVRARGESERVALVERVPIERAFDVHVAPMRVADGDDAVVLIFEDTTAMRRVEMMRVDFVANASHELRTPLAAILGFIETLQGPARNDAEARMRFLAIMAEQARRMARLVDDLLSLSRIELNAHLKPEHPVNIVAVVRQIADALSALAGDREVEIAVIDRTGGAAIIAGDGDELSRVFENLIENAIKYGASGKRVEITIEAEPRREVTVRVRDFGPGIASEHLPRLTERFYRVDIAASRDKGGTGLGLAIVKHIVARHRGRLDIESRPGQGAIFSVTFALQ
jgi:two-component system phosphate regulon sensor histidine kinase PhoR